MNRSAILANVLDPTQPQFWVPLITHYRSADGSIDDERMKRHAQQIFPHTRLWMLAGTTGDGWNLTAAQYDQLLDYACRTAWGVDRPALIFGALAPTAGAVIERIERLKARLGIPIGQALEENLTVLKQYGVVGVTICAPVGEDQTQEQIYQHLAQICEAAELPIVIYQLPQITRNRIAPATFSRLLERFPQIILFKDSGGADEIALAGPYDPALLLVRGAEGGYLQALKAGGGRYDGWLLSTGNAFAPQLAGILRVLQGGDVEAAAALSDHLTGIIDQVFALAARAPSGNPFSNANRAVDHLHAYGRDWQRAPLPTLQDGSQLPAAVLAQIAEVMAPTGMIAADGYLNQAR